MESIRRNERSLESYLLDEITELEKKLNSANEERDAAIADLTEFCRFYKGRTICDFCKHDRDDPEDCKCRQNSNKFIKA